LAVNTKLTILGYVLILFGKPGSYFKITLVRIGSVTLCE